ncbi:uncharacterized protein Dwil_GK27310 [Drosophila willistoni]|uniref:Uncharacterized protein n=1 Tax=Drosophila willistoni TaxID=7260 RepID=A0A0Q9X1L9_DROWI|nr:uncharacterized protein LOC26529312 [Drosophila willistoni]KRF97837.1 uncharacterized protein Dwil_GK27310 [Drosophila willistoni]
MIILPNEVVNHLSNSLEHFNAWTEELSGILNTAQQKQLAWNVRWPQSMDEIKDIQLKLTPTNQFKSLLWQSFYWQLRRSSGIPKSVLYQHFVLNLVKLKRAEQQPPEMWNIQLENMLLSFPQSLQTLLKSHWLCLQHQRDYLYAEAAYQFQLGANSNCSMWHIDTQRQINDHHWLRLRNVCETNYVWFINLENMMQTDNILLFHSPSRLAKRLCLNQDLGYYFTKEISKDCHWEFRDCSYLPQLLRGL